MINVIFVLSIVLAVLIAIVFIYNIATNIDGIIFIDTFISIFVCIAIIIFSDKINHEPDNKSIIDGTAKYNEILYINGTDTIKLYDIVRIDKDNKK